MTTARAIALQGFLLTPIAMAVQGLLGGESVLPPVQSPALRPPVIGSGGPGTSINLSDYLKRFTLGNPPPAAAHAPAQQAARRKQQRRAEEEILLLCAPD